MMNIDADGPILMLKLLRAVYWFDEGLSRSRNASGVRSFSRSHSLVILNVVLGMQKPYQLADAIGISRQAVSRLIADLVEAGVLMVNPDPNDGRGSILELDPESAEDMRYTLKLVRLLEQRLGKIIGDDRLGVLRAALAMDWGEPPDVTATRAAAE